MRPVSDFSIPKYKEINKINNQLYYEGTINEATFRYLSSIAEFLNTEEHQEKPQEMHDVLSSVDSLRSDFENTFKLCMKDENFNWEEFLNILKIEETTKYKNWQEFMVDINFEIMFSVLRGDLKKGFKQWITEELFEFLPLSSFEEQIEKSLKFYLKPKKYKETISPPKELDEFDSNIVNIFLYLEKNLGTEYIAEIAFDQGYSVAKVKDRFLNIYQKKEF